MSLVKNFLFDVVFLSSASSSEDVLTRIILPVWVIWNTIFYHKSYNIDKLLRISMNNDVWPHKTTHHQRIWSKYERKSFSLKKNQLLSLYQLSTYFLWWLLIHVEENLVCCTWGFCETCLRWVVLPWLFLAADNLSKDLLRFSLKIPCGSDWQFLPCSFMMTDLR